jgi:hypothetical protein
MLPVMENIKCFIADIERRLRKYGRMDMPEVWT